MGGYGVDIVDDMTAFAGSLSAGIIFAKAIVEQMYANALKDKSVEVEVAKAECNGVKQQCYIVVGRWSLLCHGN